MSESNVTEQPESVARGCVQRVVSEFFGVKWKTIPSEIVESIARAKCDKRCAEANVSTPSEEQWRNCREVWIRSIYREHARGRSRHLANDGTQRPGTPDGSLATETRKPGSLK